MTLNLRNKSGHLTRTTTTPYNLANTCGITPPPSCPDCATTCPGLTATLSGAINYETCCNGPYDLANDSGPTPGSCVFEFLGTAYGDDTTFMYIYMTCSAGDWTIEVVSMSSCASSEYQGAVEGTGTPVGSVDDCGRGTYTFTNVLGGSHPIGGSGELITVVVT